MGFGLVAMLILGGDVARFRGAFGKFCSKNRAINAFREDNKAIKMKVHLLVSSTYLVGGMHEESGQDLANVAATLCVPFECLACK